MHRQAARGGRPARGRAVDGQVLHSHGGVGASGSLAHGTGRSACMTAKRRVGHVPPDARAPLCARKRPRAPCPRGRTADKQAAARRNRVAVPPSRHAASLGVLYGVSWNARSSQSIPRRRPLLRERRPHTVVQTPALLLASSPAEIGQRSALTGQRSAPSDGQVTIFSPDPDLEALRLELARLRAVRGWSYDELAARSGLARRTLRVRREGCSRHAQGHARTSESRSCGPARSR